jgi:arsenite/tail-anchored protein-transporting ATPase
MHFPQMGPMMGAPADANVGEGLFGKLEQTKAIIDIVQKQFQDPDITTFVCVCIPEFLSVYETERLVQELYKQGMDTHNIVVNQILHVPKAMPAAIESVQRHLASSCEDAGVKKAGELVALGIEILEARKRMQEKYLAQIDELYTDFNVVRMPLLGKEVRGTKALLEFSPNLITPYEPPEM